MKVKNSLDILTCYALCCQMGTGLNGLEHLLLPASDCSVDVHRYHSAGDGIVGEHGLHLQNLLHSSHK